MILMLTLVAPVHGGGAHLNVHGAVGCRAAVHARHLPVAAPADVEGVPVLVYHGHRGGGIVVVVGDQLLPLQIQSMTLRRSDG